LRACEGEVGKENLDGKKKTKVGIRGRFGSKHSRVKMVRGVTLKLNGDKRLQKDRAFQITRSVLRERKTKKEKFLKAARKVKPGKR